MFRVFLLFIACARGNVGYESHGADWTMGSCASRANASPINIDDTGVTNLILSGGKDGEGGDFASEIKPDNSFNFTYAEAENEIPIFWAGTSFELNFPGPDFIEIPRDGGLAPSGAGELEKFILEGMRVRAPSEHTIDGLHAPLELQLWHRAADASPGKKQADDLLAENSASAPTASAPIVPPEKRVAISILISAPSSTMFDDTDQLQMRLSGGPQSKPFTIAQVDENDPDFNLDFQNLIPEGVLPPPIMGFLQTRATTRKRKFHTADPSGFLAPGLSLRPFLANATFLHYKGSDTAPPCDSFVTWLIRRGTIAVSPQQIVNSLAAFFPKGFGPGNARTVMPVGLDRDFQTWDSQPGRLVAASLGGGGSSSGSSGAGGSGGSAGGSGGSLPAGTPEDPPYHLLAQDGHVHTDAEFQAKEYAKVVQGRAEEALDYIHQAKDGFTAAGKAAQRAMEIHLA